MRDLLHIQNWKRTISDIGLTSTLNAYEAGLVKLTNKSAFTVFLIINLVYFTLSLYYSLSLPILFINSFFFPVTFLLNKLHKFTLARHYLLCIFYLMLLSISFARGRESGALFLVIPMILLSYIFFYKKKSIYIHIGLLSLFLFLILIYTSNFPPPFPYPQHLLPFVHALHLLIGLVLTMFFLSFFFLMNLKYQEELLELNNTKNKLFSIIGHDLRSPLNSLKGLLYLLNNKNLSQEDFYQLTAHLQKSTELLSNTLENLLQWSLSQMGGIRPFPSLFSLQEVVDEQTSLFSEAAKQKQLEVITEVPPDIQVFADKNHVALILRNLLNNAIKFTPEKGKIAIKANSDEKGSVITSVADTGDGLDPNHQKSLFTPHQAISKKGTSGEVGTGLGLLLCKDMVEINGGRIGFQSSDPKGSTFFFSLPQKKER